MAPPGFNAGEGLNDYIKRTYGSMSTGAGGGPATTGDINNNNNNNNSNRSQEEFQQQQELQTLMGKSASAGNDLSAASGFGMFLIHI